MNGVVVVVVVVVVLWTLCWRALFRASGRVRKKFGNYAALLSLIMRQERSIMRQIMRFHFS